MTYTHVLERLRNWFLQHKRDFPWRQEPTPYQVWISEVMLQQTQALRVVDFYKRWMKRFPTIEALATAPLDDVLKLWEGLGYYSRARSIHEASRDIVKRFNGVIPDDACKLATIKGIGPYTVGAILAFGYHQKQPAVDANVARVLARFLALEDDISKAKTLQKFRELAGDLLPDHEPHVIAEALIELGASVCKKKPECAACPLQQACKSHLAGTQNSFPVKSQKVVYETLFRDVAVVVFEDSLLVRQGKKGMACSGLYEFPYFDSGLGGKDASHLQKQLASEFALETHFEMHLDEEKHSFTRFRVTLYPKLFKAQEKRAIADHEWVQASHLDLLTFSSGHKRVMLSLVELLY